MTLTVWISCYTKKLFIKWFGICWWFLPESIITEKGIKWFSYFLILSKFVSWHVTEHCNNNEKGQQRGHKRVAEKATKGPEVGMPALYLGCDGWVQRHS